MNQPSADCENIIIIVRNVVLQTFMKLLGAKEP